jgi:hypothetical protein
LAHICAIEIHSARTRSSVAVSARVRKCAACCRHSLGVARRSMSSPSPSPRIGPREDGLERHQGSVGGTRGVLASVCSPGLAKLPVVPSGASKWTGGPLRDSGESTGAFSCRPATHLAASDTNRTPKGGQQLRDTSAGIAQRRIMNECGSPAR